MNYEIETIDFWEKLDLPQGNVASMIEVIKAFNDPGCPTTDEGEE